MGWLEDLGARVGGVVDAVRHGVERISGAVGAAGDIVSGEHPVLPVVAPPTGQCATIAEVLDRMRAHSATLAPGDGVGDFHGMYLLVTERVAAQHDAGGFADPAFMERLDCVFAGLYLDALEADSATRSAAWAPLFERRTTPEIAGLQYAISGMNAHINNDLGLAVVRTCRQLGLTLDSPGVHEDYLAVNALLAAAVREVRESFLDGLTLEVDRQASPVLDLVSSWSIDKAREAAWVSAQVQWTLQTDEQVYAAYLATLASSVGLVTRQLLTPLSELVAPES